MATRKTREDSTLKTLLKKEGIKRSALKIKTGRAPNSNVKIKTLRERSKKK